MRQYNPHTGGVCLLVLTKGEQPLGLTGDVVIDYEHMHFLTVLIMPWCACVIVMQHLVCVCLCMFCKSDFLKATKSAGECSTSAVRQYLQLNSLRFLL